MYLEGLEAFYRTHAPDKLASVPKTLKKYAGNERVLHGRLKKKYGVGHV